MTFTDTTATTTTDVRTGSRAVVPAELAAVLRLLERMGANTIVLGSARDADSLATRAELAAAWTARGGLVLDEVDWPESAASWLRQARRLTAPGPDAWVASARPRGWAGMVRRLGHLGWAPERTIVTASLTGPDALAAGGPESYAGLRGVTRDGRTWRIDRSEKVDASLRSAASLLDPHAPHIR